MKEKKIQYFEISKQTSNVLETRQLIEKHSRWNDFIKRDPEPTLSYIFAGLSRFVKTKQKKMTDKRDGASAEYARIASICAKYACGAFSSIDRRSIIGNVRDE